MQGSLLKAIYILIFVTLLITAAGMLINSRRTGHTMVQQSETRHIMLGGIWNTTDKTPRYPEVSQVEENCLLPLGGFRGWNDGVVTALKPEIERNCAKIFAGDKKQIEIVNARNKNWSNPLSDEDFLNRTRNCTWVTDYFKNNLYITKLERSFPMAYSFVVHNSPQQVLRLMRFLYRPGNSYCVHPDHTSSPIFSGIFQNVAGCLENVIISSKRVKVRWGHSTLIEAARNCLEDLLQLRSKLPPERKWNYVINLCGKEIPLVSPHGIVSRLSKLNGLSDIRAGEVRDSYNLKRLHNRTIPYGLTLYKSSTFMALSYKFAHFTVTNSRAIKLYEFFKKRCSMPEEHYYATLYHMPGVPGGFDPKTSKDLFAVANAIWLFGNTPCKGKKIHAICVTTVGDLEFIMKKRKGNDALFHNKYFMELDHTIMDCTEERLVKENKKEFEQDGCLELTKSRSGSG